MADLTINERNRDSVTILDLKGDIRLAGGDAILHNALRTRLERGDRKILLNLAGVEHIDSAGLGELVAGFTTVGRSGGRIKLLRLTERVNELMMITKLLTVFDTYDDEDEAIASFAGGANSAGA
jgi:anti-sigma B factor antagonist